MKTKFALKSIFVIFLTMILVCLVIIILDRNNYSMPALVDYFIEDNSNECYGEKELIYSDKDYNYYLPCNKSSNITIHWDEGVSESLSHSLKYGKVSIESLIKHGLGIIKNEK